MRDSFKKYNTKFCCTLTTGIFVTISANASVETNDNVPYWRTIKNNGEVNENIQVELKNIKNFLKKRII